MPRKKRRQRYGDYCEQIDGQLYGAVSIPVGGGKYKRKRKKVSSAIEARQWALQELERVHHGNVAGGELRTFIDLAEWYKEYFLVNAVFEKGLKVEGTKDAKRQRDKLDRMAAHFGPKRIASFSEQDLRAYTRHRRTADKVTQATINRDLALLRAMFRKGREADRSIIVPKFPINPSAETERDRVMSFEEERRILDACNKSETLQYQKNGKTVTTDKHETKREHLRAIIILAVDTALRAGEIFKLEWKDVDLDAGVITVIKENAKTQRTRKVGMTPRVKAELEQIRRPCGKVFAVASVNRSFPTACRRAKVKDLVFHDLRHTATTRMIRAGIPHTEVMKITGHTQIKTFLRYLNLGDQTVKNTADLLADFLNKSQ
jgi:integrase